MADPSLLQSISILVATVGGLVAAGKAIYEMQLNRQQRAKELRWRQANVGKELIDEFHENTLASAAMRMLDWNGREFEVTKDALVPISTADVLGGLRTEGLNFLDDKDAFIRDSFDSFFFHVHRVEQSIRNELTTLEDVRFPLDYYGEKMSEHAEVYAKFMHTYGYGPAADFYTRRLGMPFERPAALPPAAGGRTLK